MAEGKATPPAATRLKRSKDTTQPARRRLSARSGVRLAWILLIDAILFALCFLAALYLLPSWHWALRIPAAIAIALLFEFVILVLLSALAEPKGEPEESDPAD